MEYVKNATLLHGKESRRRITMNNQQKELRDIRALRPWDKNPKTLSKIEFIRLKKQIQRLGVYKPLIISEDGIVLGGNSRLRAFQELGIRDVWVSVVDAPTDAKKLEYCLSDNDVVGEVNEEELVSLLTEEEGDIPLGDYKINLGSISLDKLITKFGPGDEFEVEETKPEKNKNEIVCPECGAIFTK